MTGYSVVEQGRRVFEDTDNDQAKKVLHIYSEECPRCGANRFDEDDNLNWKMLRPIKVISDNLHFVNYKCKCGKEFKKVEVNK